MFGFPKNQFEFWNIKTYKFIYITEKIQYEQIFLTDENNIINLKDDDHVIIGNYMVVCKFSYKSRNIVKVYDFNIMVYYQLNNLLFFHYIIIFLSLIYTKKNIAELAKLINILIL